MEYCPLLQTLYYNQFTNLIFFIMKKISNETLSQVTGGKFWGSRVECRVQANGHCMSRKVYYRFGIRSYGGWWPANPSQC